MFPFAVMVGRHASICRQLSVLSLTLHSFQPSDNAFGVHGDAMNLSLTLDCQLLGIEDAQLSALRRSTMNHMCVYEKFQSHQSVALAADTWEEVCTKLRSSDPSYRVLQHLLYDCGINSYMSQSCE